MKTILFKKKNISICPPRSDFRRSGSLTFSVQRDLGWCLWLHAKVHLANHHQELWRRKACGQKNRLVIAQKYRRNTLSRSVPVTIGRCCLFMQFTKVNCTNVAELDVVHQQPLANLFTAWIVRIRTEVHPNIWIDQFSHNTSTKESCLGTMMVRGRDQNRYYTRRKDKRDVLPVLAPTGIRSEESVRWRLFAIAAAVLANEHSAETEKRLTAGLATQLHNLRRTPGDDLLDHCAGRRSLRRVEHEPEFSTCLHGTSP